MMTTKRFHLPVSLRSGVQRRVPRLTVLPAEIFCDQMNLSGSIETADIDQVVPTIGRQEGERANEGKVVTETQRETLRAVYTIPEAAAVLGIGRNLAYAGAREGWLPTLRCGRRLVVPRLALETLLSQPIVAARSQLPETRD
jgi:excisionase family DNA binding protein